MALDYTPAAQGVYGEAGGEMCIRDRGQLDQRDGMCAAAGFDASDKGYVV